MATETISVSQSMTFSTMPQPVRWIVSPKYDLTFFMGSCVLTFAFYGLYWLACKWGFVIGGDAILITYFIFTAILDHPHIFQTFSRTHYDFNEFAKRKMLYTWGLGGFVAFGFVILALGWEAYLIVGAAFYGTWHIMRQHYGLIKIYKGLNRDYDRLDQWIDGLTFWVGMLSCFFYDYSDIHGPLVIYGDLKVWFPTVPSSIGETGRIIFVLLLIVLTVRTIVKYRQKKAINIPKLILMAASLGTHYGVFFLTATPFLVAEALETAYHDVQYHGFVMHFQRQRFPNIKRIVLKWFGVAMLYGLIVGVIEILGLLNRGWAMWLFVPSTMIVVFHYYVDGLIWKLRDNPELKSLLISR
jgi:hypothetical protein